MFARLPSNRLFQTLEPQSICLRCFRRLQRQRHRLLHTSTPRQQHGVLTANIRRAVGDGQYFWANGALKELLRSSGKPSYSNALRQQSTATLDPTEPPPPKPTTIPDLSSQFSGQTSTISSQLPPNESFPLRRRRSKRTDDNEQLPLDASNRLTTHASALPARSLRRLLTTYLSLSKPRLTFLIVLTTTSAYTLYPVPSLLSSAATATPSLSTLTLLFLTTGTFFTSASANALNMLLEPKHDARMSRTRNRPLVRGLISKTGALLFALATATLGTSALWWGVNPTTAVLGAGNIALYAFVYTPLKRISVVNTWVGAVVGAIPPLMGWTAAAGQVAVVGAEGLWGEAKELLLGEGSVGGWLLAGLLFCWQFPHFNALSWPIREEYKQAGYRMLCWVNPARNARVALRYSILLVPVCVGLSFYGITEPVFVPMSLAVNCWVVYEAVKFWKYEGYKGSARGLFWASVWHLPIVLVLAMVLKKGLWERTWRALGFGEDWDQDEEWEVVESGLEDA